MLTAWLRHNNDPQMHHGLSCYLDLQVAEWIHSTADCPPNLWINGEYAFKASERTGARINMDRSDFNHQAAHRHGTEAIVIHDLMPYLVTTS